MGYRSSNKSVSSAKCHLVWCPKYRKGVLVGAIEARLKRIIGEVGGEVIEVEVMPDHLHLLVTVPPQVRLSRLMKPFAGRWFRLLRDEFPFWSGGRMGGLWSPWWFCSAVGGARLEVVRRSVVNQRAVA